MNLLDKLRRLKSSLRQVSSIYRFGGVKYSIVACPVYGEILKGTVALITGGGSGIGLAIAKKFVACGARVIITGRTESKLQSVIAELGKDVAKYIVWDVTDVSSVHEKLVTCRDAFGADIDILVNNAGVAPSKFFGDVDEEEWDRIYDTNLKGVYFLSQAIAKEWKSAPSSRVRKILNISSQGGFVGATYPYRMAKWDLRGLTEGLGKLLAPDNILVNAIAPGVVKTEMQRFSLEQGDNLYTNQNPLKRVCLPEEVAELAIFLCSDTANFIVGQTIVCDGGYSLK